MPSILTHFQDWSHKIMNYEWQARQMMLYLMFFFSQKTNVLWSPPLVNISCLVLKSFWLQILGDLLLYYKITHLLAFSWYPWNNLKVILGKIIQKVKCIFNFSLMDCSTFLQLQMYTAAIIFSWRSIYAMTQFSLSWNTTCFDF